MMIDDDSLLTLIVGAIVLISLGFMIYAVWDKQPQKPTGGPTA